MLISAVFNVPEIRLRVSDQTELLHFAPRNLQVEVTRCGKQVRTRVLIDNAPFPRPGQRPTEFDKRLAFELKASIERYFLPELYKTRPEFNPGGFGGGVDTFGAHSFGTLTLSQVL